MSQITENQLEIIKERFFLSGESVADWARLHNFNRALVYSVLSGRIKCKRGEAHRIAVALGLKPLAQKIQSEHQNADEGDASACPDKSVITQVKSNSGGESAM